MTQESFCIKKKNEWIGERETDLNVAQLEIDPERAQVMEFSKPFKYQGLVYWIQSLEDVQDWF